jgi:hypothetical protein
MNTANKCTKDITVAKHGIHDIISELVSKFNFDKFLFPQKHKFHNQEKHY